jgi:hypothetical protein
MVTPFEKLVLRALYSILHFCHTHSLLEPANSVQVLKDLDKAIVSGEYK